MAGENMDARRGSSEVWIGSVEQDPDLDPAYKTDIMVADNKRGKGPLHKANYGLRHADQSRGKKPCFSAFWCVSTILLILTALALSATAIIQYLGNETAFKLYMQPRMPEMPAITVCQENAFRLSELLENPDTAAIFGITKGKIQPKVKIDIKNKPEPTKPEPKKPEPTKPKPEPTTPEPTNPELPLLELEVPELPTPEPTKPEPPSPEPTNKGKKGDKDGKQKKNKKRKRQVKAYEPLPLMVTTTTTPPATTSQVPTYYSNCEELCTKKYAKTCVSSDCFKTNGACQCADIIMMPFQWPGPLGRCYFTEMKGGAKRYLSTKLACEKLGGWVPRLVTSNNLKDVFEFWKAELARTRGRLLVEGSAGTPPSNSSGFWMSAIATTSTYIVAYDSGETEATNASDFEYWPANIPAKNRLIIENIVGNAHGYKVASEEYEVQYPVCEINCPTPSTTTTSATATTPVATSTQVITEPSATTESVAAAMPYVQRLKGLPTTTTTQIQPMPTTTMPLLIIKTVPPQELREELVLSEAGAPTLLATSTTTQQQVNPSTAPTCEGGSYLSEAEDGTLECVTLPSSIQDLADIITSMPDDNAIAVSTLFAELAPYLGLQLAGYELHQFIMDCGFRGMGNWDCGNLFDGSSFAGQIGSCFTLNGPNTTKVSPRRANELHFTGLINQSDYTELSPTAGLKIFLHDRGTHFVPDVFHYKVAPGKSVQFTISPAVIKLRFDCHENAKPSSPFLYAGSHTFEGCERSIRQECVVQKCGCAQPGYPKPASVDYCEFGNYTCVSSATGECRGIHHCKRPCTYTEFNLVVTETTRPANAWLNTVCNNNKKDGDDEKCRKNLADQVRVSLHLPNSWYTVAVECHLYGITKLMSDIGSAFGALLGMSALACVMDMTLKLDRH